jgi:hypothetical protein
MRDARGFITQRKSGTVIALDGQRGTLGMALAGLAAFRPAHLLWRAARCQVFAHDLGPLGNEFAMGKAVAFERRAGNLPEMLVETVHACQL